MISDTHDRRTIRFDVDGMSCGGCRDAITEQVQRIEGVNAVDVDIDAALVTVRGEELAEQVVRDAILLAGYDARMR